MKQANNYNINNGSASLGYSPDWRAEQAETTDNLTSSEYEAPKIIELNRSNRQDIGRNVIYIQAELDLFNESDSEDYLIYRQPPETESNQ